MKTLTTSASVALSVKIDYWSVHFAFGDGADIPCLSHRLPAPGVCLFRHTRMQSTRHQKRERAPRSIGLAHVERRQTAQEHGRGDQNREDSDGFLWQA